MRRRRRQEDGGRYVPDRSEGAGRLVRPLCETLEVERQGAVAAHRVSDHAHSVEVLARPPHVLSVNFCCL